MWESGGGDWRDQRPPWPPGLRPGTGRDNEDPAGPAFRLDPQDSAPSHGPGVQSGPEGPTFSPPVAYDYGLQLEGKLCPFGDPADPFEALSLEIRGS